MKQVVDERLSPADFVSAGAAKTAEEKREQEAREEQAPGTIKDTALAPLLPGDYVAELRSRWERIQAGFVDEPKTAVQQADELVSQTIQRLTKSFADSRNELERQWSSGNGHSTENLRVAFRKYRSFFEHLLSV